MASFDSTKQLNSANSSAVEHVLMSIRDTYGLKSVLIFKHSNSNFNFVVLKCPLMPSKFIAPDPALEKTLSSIAALEDADCSICLICLENIEHSQPVC